MNNKKLLVFSDSHGDVRTLAKILQWAKTNEIERAVFLGDGTEDLPIAKAMADFSGDIQAVRGNGDFTESVPEAAVMDFANSSFFLCHGHRYSLYGGIDTLVAIARNNGADAALFGHTHVPYCQTVNSILLVNPGSISRPRSNTGATFAVIECLTQLKVNFWGIGKSAITKIEI